MKVICAKKAGLRDAQCCANCMSYSPEPYESMGYCSKYEFIRFYGCLDDTYASNGVNDKDVCDSFEG